jgi:hypothetical protein
MTVYAGFLVVSLTKGWPNLRARVSIANDSLASIIRPIGVHYDNSYK